MNISRIIPHAQPPLTRQQCADLALSAWQDQKRAKLRGDLDRFRELDNEITAICEHAKICDAGEFHDASGKPLWDRSGKIEI